MNEEQCEKLIKIANYYGIRKQLLKLNEECLELAHESIKQYWEPHDLKHLIEEFADSMIVTGQIIYLLGINPKAIDDVINFKIDRQIKRIEEKEEKCKN